MMTHCGIKSFIAVFGILSLFSWSMWTFVVSQITSIEKAFGLTSSESGWLLTIWELGYVSFTVVASYVSHWVNLPRTIGLATILCAFSAWIFALPHAVAFLPRDLATDMTSSSEPSNGSVDQLSFTIDERVDDICVPRELMKNILAFINATTNTGVEQIKAKTSNKMLAYALFNIGMFLQGVSKAPCYPYSAQYVDDNVDKSKTGFYLSIASSIAIFGLAVGYGLGSIINKIYVTLKSVNLDSSDSRYIGAWWLGEVILGSLTFFTAFPMLCFPKRYNVTSDKTTGEYHPPTNSSKRKQHKLKDIVVILWSFITTPMYILVLLTAVFQILALATFLGFEPKYMETQFHIPAWKSNIILGVVSIISFSMGNLVGGYVTKHWTMTPRLVMKIILVFHLAAMSFLLINTFIGCDHQEVYNPLDNDTLLDQHPCDCNRTELLPVCSVEEGVNYFSPCHAGCSDYSGQMYYNCSRVPGGVVKSGLCDSGCQMVIPYCIVKFAMNFVDAIVGIPIFIVFLRSVGEENKALALGLSAAVTSLLSWLPGPVIGGKLIDSSCLFWNTASTGSLYCGLYNIVDQRYKLHGIMLGLRAVGLIFLLSAVYVSRGMTTWVPNVPDIEIKDVELSITGGANTTAQNGVTVTKEDFSTGTEVALIHGDKTNDP